MTTTTATTTTATTTARRPKQTAGNNAFLAACRRLFNDATYARVLALVNGPEGEPGARAYLLKSVVKSLDF